MSISFSASRPITPINFSGHKKNVGKVTGNPKGRAAKASNSNSKPKSKTSRN